MNHQLHTLYRALIDYRKNTINDRECKLQRSAIITADNESDLIEITRKHCVVEEDWIDAIEKGLVFIEKAIKEERQFIRSNGEVIPIEKVKRVSKDSVEHLAKHSNLLTREPEEGQDVVPDNLYTVERLSDFTVYENRFLYMLLCYLRDFISIRYEKILELTNTYNGKLKMTKTIVESNRRVVYEVNLEEEKKNDDYLRENNQAQNAIDRMLTIYKAVVFFLNTPLMSEVSKVAMLKPPITRTNVLKMNRNFREALSLYEYVTAYDKDGYEIKTEKKALSPFVGVVADEIAETIELSSLLTYEHGLGIKELFKRHYDKEEERKKEEEKRKYAEQLKNISRHIEESGLSPEEYIAMLEKRIKDLEEREEDILAARTVIDELHTEIDRLTDDLRHSKEKISSLKYELAELYRKYDEDMENERVRHEEEIAELNEEHANEIQSLHDEYANEISDINDEHAREVDEINQMHEGKIARINDEHAREIVELNDAHEQKVVALNESHQAEVDAINLEHNEKVNALNQMILGWETRYKETEEKYIAELRETREKAATKERELSLEIEDKRDEIKDLEKKCARLEEKKTLSDARLNAIRSEYGLMTDKDDFTSKAMCDEIEHQYVVFKKFFKTEWKKTKIAIKKELLGEKRFFGLFGAVKQNQKPETSKKMTYTYSTNPADITDANKDISDKPIEITKQPVLEQVVLERQEVASEEVVIEQQTTVQDIAENSSASEQIAITSVNEQVESKTDEEQVVENSNEQAIEQAETSENTEEKEQDKNKQSGAVDE